MSTTTDMRDKYVAAEAAILTGQQFRWGERQLTRADLGMVQAGRREWTRLANAEAQGNRPVGVMLANLTGYPNRPEGVGHADNDYDWPYR